MDAVAGGVFAGAFAFGIGFVDCHELADFVLDVSAFLFAEPLLEKAHELETA